MRHLPSEREAAIAAASAEYNSTGRLDICQPCDCNGQIRHNNGGNYHGRVFLRRDSGNDFVAYDSTSEFDSLSEWEPVRSVRKIIEEYADWL